MKLSLLRHVLSGLIALSSTATFGAAVAIQSLKCGANTPETTWRIISVDYEKKQNDLWLTSLSPFNMPVSEPAIIMASEIQNTIASFKIYGQTTKTYYSLILSLTTYRGQLVSDSGAITPLICVGKVEAQD